MCEQTDMNRCESTDRCKLTREPADMETYSMESTGIYLTFKRNKFKSCASSLVSEKTDVNKKKEGNRETSLDK